MKVQFFRRHTVRPVDYESMIIGADVEIDTEVDEEFMDLTDAEIGTKAEALLDTLLDKQVDRALRLGGTMDESHLWDFYEKD